MNYEIGLKRILEMLGPNHQYYSDALVLQQRLLENLHQEKLFGSTETTRSERSGLISALNRISIAALQVSFNDLCSDRALLSSSDLGRISYLTELIRESHALIREYEQSIRLTSDPKERMRADRLTSEQRVRIQTFISELNSIVPKTGSDIPEDVAQIMARYGEPKGENILTTIRQALLQGFSLNELRLLCSDLGVDFDALPNGPREEMVVALLDYLLRRSRIDELKEYIQNVRPGLIQN